MNIYKLKLLQLERVFILCSDPTKLYLKLLSYCVITQLYSPGVVVVFDPFGTEHSDKSMNDKLWEKR